jgi:hypothetical protein
MLGQTVTLQDIKDFDALTDEINRRLAVSNRVKYFDDPAGYIEDVLGETLTDDLRAICESVVKYSVTIAQSGNGTGKSFIESRIALWFFDCRTEPQVFAAAAPPQANLENILWAELETACDAHPYITSDCDRKNLKITRKPKEFIAGVSIPTQGTDKEKEARFGGKHAPSMLFLVDEGDAVPDPVYSGIETCLSGGFEKLLITFNPRQRLGWVYRAIKDGRANVVKLSAFSHPNVITGEERIPGAVNREKTLRRIAQWTRPVAEGEVPDKQCFKLPDFLVGCTPHDQKGQPYPPLKAGWYKIIEHQFSHVVLGEYPAQAANQLISEEWVDLARSRYDMFVAKHGVLVPESTNCSAGLDIAEMGEDSSVLVKRFGNFVHPLSSWNKQDVIEVGDCVRDDLIANGITNISAIYCDGTGVGAGTAPYMARQYSLPAVKVMVASSPTGRTEDDGEFGLLLDQLMWKVREWLRTDLAMLPPDQDLIEELLAFTYETKGRYLKVSSTDDIKALLKRSPDRARALMLSFMTSGFFTDSDLS